MNQFDILWDFKFSRLPPSSLMMEAARTSETSVDNYFTRQYIPEDNSELQQFDILKDSLDGGSARRKGIYLHRTA
jgi:hypothetical protein